MKVLGGKALISSVMLALLALSIVPLATLAGNTGTQTTTNTQTTASSNRQVNLTEVAEVMVSKVKSLVSWVSDTIETYNISLPTPLQKVLNKSVSILRNATDLISSNPRAAIHESMKAAQILMPVVRYVSTAFPTQYRVVLKGWALHRAIRERQEVVERMEKVLNYLQNKSVEVPPEISEAVEGAQTSLEKAKRCLQEGNISEAARMLGNANRNISKALEIFKHGVTKEWHAAVITEAAIKHFGISIGKLAFFMNRTISMIEENKTAEAEKALNHLANASKALMTRLEELKERVNNNTACFKIINESETVAKIINNASVNALNALKENNTELAVLILQDALSKVRPVIHELIVQASWAHGKLKWIQGLVERMRGRVAEVMKHKLSWIGKHPMVGKGLMGLKNLITSLNHAYRNGLISCSTYKEALMNIQSRIKDALSKGNIPPQIKMLLSNILRMVGNELNQISCSNP